MTLRPLAVLIAVAAASKATAAESPADAAARKALLDLVPQARIDAIEPAPFPGYRQVVSAGQIVYISDDGKYLLQGTLIDTQNRRDLTAERIGKDVKRKLDAVPDAQHITYGPAKPKYKVTVFTDIDCGYCRKLHGEMAEYNKRGIEIDYLFFPRSGPNTPAFEEAISVWCAKDRKATLTAAKAGQKPPVLKCDNPIADQFKLGTEVGVNGTPAIYAPDGTKIGGYVPPDEMLKRLDAMNQPKSLD